MSSIKNWYLKSAVATSVLVGFATAQQNETGYIQIVAEPGIRVFVEGKLAGSTSDRDQGLVLNNVGAGKYRLRFEKDGFESRVAELSVSPGEVTVYTLYSLAPSIDIQEDDAERTGFLEPKTGVLEFVCLPVYCSISIPELELDNYTKRSSTMMIHEVLATRYQVTISVGDSQLQEMVELEPNTTLKLFANFTNNRPLLETTVARPEIRQIQIPKPTARLQPSYEVTLEKPLAVLIGNADAAYPQKGLIEATSIFEMPIEDGLTTLMSIYTQTDPAQVGPITSARDYFLEAALAMNGTLIHVGGSPSALGRIASQDLPTVDALQEGDLFTQAPEQTDPNNIFSTGEVLRNAVGSLEDRASGTVYSPPSDAPEVSSLTVDYSAVYTSGFRYLPDLDLYRWIRGGADAGDAGGEAVVTDAVVVARVTAFPYTGDPKRRLYLPYSGGEATLYLRGKAIPGSWTPTEGFTFQAQDGTAIDLTPFKNWVLFAPDSAKVSVE